jgi:NADPH-dependent F420 reductase
VNIAILGGTGDIGEGIALRLLQDTDHTIVIGSREKDRAEATADEYDQRVDTEGVVEGVPNRTAVARCSVIVLAVPPKYVSNTIEAVSSELNGDDVLVSPAVGMTRDEDGFHYDRPRSGSVAEIAVNSAPNGVAVVGAFQNLAAGALSGPDTELGYDVVVTGDETDAKDRIAAVINDIEGLRSLDAGPLSNSAEIESITPLLINLAMNNQEMHDLGVKFK